jgi:hypothetical protein
LSPSPEQLEYASLLTRRAEGDLYACRLLADDPGSDEGIVGFHAQQAVEKALKVALVLAGVDFPRTHDLGFLLARVRELGSETPSALRDIEWQGCGPRTFAMTNPRLSIAALRAATPVGWVEGLRECRRWR